MLEAEVAGLAPSDPPCRLPGQPLQSLLHIPIGGALALFCLAALAFMVAPPLGLTWWLAHFLFAAGFLLLSGNGLMGRPGSPAEEPDSLGETAFAFAPEAILLVSGEGRIRKANNRARLLFGYGDGELSMVPLERLLPGQSVARREGDPDYTGQAQDFPPPSEGKIWCRGIRRDGSPFPAEIALAPLPPPADAGTIIVVRDITGTEHFADQMQQSERRFQDLFDHAPIGMALAALGGRLFEVNESLCRLLGHAREELLGQSFLDLLHPDNHEESTGQFQQLVAGRVESFRGERRYLHRSGAPVWVLLSASLQRLPTGIPSHVVAQIIDIGGIKAAQEALAQSEQRLQRVLEGSNDGFWDRHIPSGITTFSRRWAGILGYEQEEIAPSIASWEALVHPEDLLTCRQLLAEHLDGQRDRYEAVYRMRHKAGHWVWILARGKVYEWDGAGNPVRMAGTHTDVTIRQLTTEALRLRERTLKAVLEALPIGIWIADANGRITSANAAALAIGPGVRYRCLNPAGGNDDARDVPGRTMAPHDWALAHAIKGRERVKEELVEIELADGSRRTVLNAGLPILDELGNPLGAVAVNQDMTQWLKLEQDLLTRTHQLEESNRELEQFAYVASHDLQEPLRKVSSFAQLFAKKYSEHLDDTGQTYINFMVDGASRMQILVDDLLHYSRLTRSDHSHSQVDMTQVLAGVLADLQLAIREAGAMILSDPLPPVQGDAGQLRALLQNLISNAVKYRAPERSPVIHIGASLQAGNITFWVRDNGIGVAPRYFERIFVIFQRLHARSEYPGTGIGLAICKKIVDNHGGRIWVESAPGQGATFFFTLPSGEIRTL